MNQALGDTYDLTTEASRVVATTLLIYAKSPILGSAVAESYRASMPNSSLVWMRGGHLPSAEDARSFESVVVPFLAAGT